MISYFNLALAFNAAHMSNKSLQDTHCLHIKYTRRHKKHVQIQEFCRGSRPDGKKTAWTTFFLVLILFYSLQRGSNGFIAEKTILSKGSRGGPNFSKGGIQMLISIETHITYDFLGGGGDPLSPLWIRT